MNTAEFAEIARCFLEPVLLVSQQGNVLTVNAAASRLLAPEGDPTNRPLHEFVHETPTQLTEFLAACVASDQPINGVLTCRASAIHTLCHGRALAVLTDSAGAPILLRCTPGITSGNDVNSLGVQLDDYQREIEHRHRIEAQLRSTTVHAQAVLETAADAIITIDQHGIVQSCNPAAERLFGYGAEELIGGNVKQLMPPPYRDQHDGYLRRYLETGERRIIGVGREVVGLRKDGRTFPMELAVSEVKLTNQHHFTGIVRDISERRRIEERLRQRNEELRLMIEYAPIGIAVSDLKCRYLHANPAFCAMLGYTEEQLQELTLGDIVHPDDLPHNLDFAIRLRRGEIDSFHSEFRYLRRDRTALHVAAHVGLIRDAAGQPLRVVGLVEDRSSERRAAEELRQHRERLAHTHRLSIMGELGTGIAHEINQPLTAIATYAHASRRLLDIESIGVDELRITLDKIAVQAERASEVIGRLRAFIRKRDSRRERHDLTALAHKAILLAEIGARGHNISVVIAATPKSMPVMVDPIQIQQVILNLIHNAIDATTAIAKGSEVITIRIDAEPDMPEEVRLAVTDRGAGISDEAAEQLFHSFFTTKTEGIGMGLAICRSIVNAHGGHMGYCPNPPRGSTVYFTLPRATVTDDV